MGMGGTITTGAVLTETKRTNELLKELIAAVQAVHAEVRHANELTRSTMPAYDRQ